MTEGLRNVVCWSQAHAMCQGMFLSTETRKGKACVGPVTTEEASGKPRKMLMYLTRPSGLCAGLPICLKQCFTLLMQ